MKKGLLISSLLVMFFLSIPGAYAELVVIGNKNNPVAMLSKAQLTDIFLGKSVEISEGKKFSPINQPQDSSLYQLFYKNLLGWGPDQIESYWLLGRSSSIKRPAEIADDFAAIIDVGQQENKVAYIDERSLNLAQNDSVKILFRLSDNQSAAQEVNAMSTSTQNDIARTNIWDLIRNRLTLTNEVNRPEVKSELEWYLAHPHLLNRILQNATPYISYIYQQTFVHNVPVDFALLPLVESGYNPFAYSSAGAVGIWQMMPGTAVIYGLDINWWYDGRRDIVTSTNRALDFLAHLHHSSGDWLLAAAAYNAGGDTIKNSVEANRHNLRNTDFWNLSLPTQTKHYVPKLIALVAIISSPEKYGINLPFISAKPYFTGITLGCQLTLAEAAALAGTSTAEIQLLNPGLRRWASDPNNPYTLLIPGEKATIFEQNLSQLVGKTHLSWQYHEVHEGQTLASIAHNYHTDVDLLRKVNQLAEEEEIPVNQGIIVPLHLNRTYQTPLSKLPENGQQIVQAQISNSNNSANPPANNMINANNITVADLLSGHPIQIESKSEATSNNDKNNIPAYQLQPSLPKEPLAVISGNDPGNIDLSEQTVEQTNPVPKVIQPRNSVLGISSKPISEKDNLQAILKKLYGADAG